MKISLNWVSDFVDLSGVDLINLIDRLTLSTAEVEEVTEFGRDINGIIAAKIVRVEEIPKSKKLHFVEVDTGSGLTSCVCGAPNVRVGMVVPFAQLGAQVGELTITKVTLMDTESNGMCCSARELGISADHSGLLELPENTPLGTDIKKLLPIEDTVFEIDNKSLTNRPDLWCHYGFAREVSAITGKKLKTPMMTDLTDYDMLPAVSLTIQTPERCFRYTGLAIDNVTKKVAPLKMQTRLFYCGMRSINLLADLTNYVMLEMGQPMHAFDKTLVGAISVKNFDKAFEFTTLDGIARTIDPETLMICSDGKPVAIAGIMGGANSEISDNTTSVLLESADFEGVGIRKASGRLGLRTEASARYEKMLDPELASLASMRFAHLLAEIDPGIQIASRLTDLYVKKYRIITLNISQAYIEKYIGEPISPKEITTTLTSLGFGVTATKDGYSVTVPSWRSTKDVTIKVDLIEEITRIHGYNNIALRATLNPLEPVIPQPYHEAEYRAKQLLAEACGLSEIHSYIWNDNRFNKEAGIQSPGVIHVVNALSPEQSELRSSIVPSLLYAAASNRANAPFGIFEIGRTVPALGTDAKCIEKRMLGILLADRKLSEEALYLKLRDTIAVLATGIKNQKPGFTRTAIESQNWTHPVNAATIQVDGKTIGTMSVLNPNIAANIDKKLRIVFAEIDFETFAEVAEKPVFYTEISRFPSVDLDLNLLMDKQTAYSALAAVIDDFATDILSSYEVIDQYEGEALGGKKSMTLRFHLASRGHTLTGEEAAAFSEGLLAKLGNIGIELRR